MLSCKKILFLAITAISFAGCLEQRILFDFKKDVNQTFFKEVPGIGDALYINYPVTKKAIKAEVYVSSFRERFIENDDLLEYSELNDQSKIPAVDYWDVNGYSQNLYLLKFEFTYSVKDREGNTVDISAVGAVFFSVKRNGQNKVTGITPCYFGTVDEDENLINFDTELTLENKDDNFYLKLHKKKKNVKGLLFMPADFPANPTSQSDKFNIKKIVQLDPNKVGGHKPLVFNINKVLKDPNALQFHYVNTIQLTQ
jgi:hypothetical protein